MIRCMKFEKCMYSLEKESKLRPNGCELVLRLQFCSETSGARQACGSQSVPSAPRASSPAQRTKDGLSLGRCSTRRSTESQSVLARGL